MDICQRFAVLFEVIVKAIQPFDARIKGAKNDVREPCHSIFCCVLELPYLMDCLALYEERLHGTKNAADLVLLSDGQDLSKVASTMVLAFKGLKRVLRVPMDDECRVRTTSDEKHLQVLWVHRLHNR